jgi:hypothetical protein
MKSRDIGVFLLVSGVLFSRPGTTPYLELKSPSERTA